MTSLRKISRGDRDGSFGVLFTLTRCDVTDAAAGQALALVIWLGHRSKGPRPHDETETLSGP